MKILVLGMGNDLFGDDGAGLQAVRLLRDAWLGERVSPPPSETVDFAECLVSGAALLDIVHGYDALVVMDTIMKAKPVTGRVRILEAANVRDIPGPSPHYISVPQVLELGRQLGLKMPKTVVVVAVETKNLFRLGEGLSKAMQARLPDLAAAAKRILYELLAAPDQGTERLRKRLRAPLIA